MSRRPPIKPTKRLVNLMVTLATGFLPWGIDWRHKMDDGSLQCGIQRHSGRDFILCCGHTFKPATIMALVRRGFLTRGKKRDGTAELIATERGKRWAWRHRFDAEGPGQVAFAMAGGVRELPLGHHHPDDEAYRAAEKAGAARDPTGGWPVEKTNGDMNARL